MCGDNVNPTAMGNTHPKHLERVVTLTILNEQRQPVATIQVPLTYNLSTGDFRGTTTAALADGLYQAWAHLNGYLVKQVPGFITVAATSPPVTVASLSLVTADINGDNQLDILDYNALIGCFGSKQTSSTCTAAPTGQSQGADITDDGVVDGTDYNLFLRELSIQRGE